ncbi:hypothetical protein AYI70_g7454 [Smittium culicis]|uniref:Uncharacterized protein n=2 Tax=Smittium culicis TaxID=133412 RepID=A0A1R1XKN2_9FUNG|nr:hypothetical protein AYI70_g7454 [Smittium culicis]
MKLFVVLAISTAVIVSATPQQAKDAVPYDNLKKDIDAYLRQATLTTTSTSAGTGTSASGGSTTTNTKETNTSSKSASESKNSTTSSSKSQTGGSAGKMGSVNSGIMNLVVVGASLMALGSLV